MESEPRRPRPLAFWAVGLVLVGGGVALSGVIGGFAVVPFVAGLGVLFVYYVKETGAARRRGSPFGGSGDPVLLAPGDDGDNDDGGWGDGGGGDGGGGGNGG